MPRARNIASSKPGSQLQSRNQKTDHNFQQKLEQTKPWETRKRGKQSKITKLIRYQKTHNRSLGQLSNKRGEKERERKTGIDPYQHQVVFYIRRDPTEIFEGIPRPSSIGLRLGLEERIHLSLSTNKENRSKSPGGERTLVLPSPFIRHWLPWSNVGFFWERLGGSCDCRISHFTPLDHEPIGTGEPTPSDRMRAGRWQSSSRVSVRWLYLSIGDAVRPMGLMNLEEWSPRALLHRPPYLDVILFIFIHMKLFSHLYSLLHDIHLSLFIIRCYRNK